MTAGLEPLARQRLMSHLTLDALAAFCAGQRAAFDPVAWLRRSDADGKVIGVTAQYLAMTSWYGHHTELQSIAETICPGISNLAVFNAETRLSGLDLGRLSVRARHPAPVAQRAPAGHAAASV